MTGAIRGIGRIAAEHILRRSPETHLLVVARESTGRSFGDNVSYVGADLGSLTSVRSAATEIGDRLDRGELPPLRQFVRNAGIQHTDDLTEGPEGIESTFMVNVLANHVFVRTLEDRFTDGGRIVITTSDTHVGDLRHNLAMVPAPAWLSPGSSRGRVPSPDPRPRAQGVPRIRRASWQPSVSVHEYARRLPAGVEVISYNPGSCPAPASHVMPAPSSGRDAHRSIVLAFTPFGSHRGDAGRNLAEVVMGDIHAATGSYIDRDTVSRSSAESYHSHRERELWDAAERLTTPHRTE